MLLSSAHLLTTNAIFVPISNIEEFKTVEKRFFDIGAGYQIDSPCEFDKTHLEFDNFTGLLCFKNGALLACDQDTQRTLDDTLHCDLDNVLTLSLSPFKKRIEENMQLTKNHIKAKDIARKILGLKKEDLNDEVISALTFIEQIISAP
jgi:hypothetical protein